jgi:RHS repeat-associated protein
MANSGRGALAVDASGPFVGLRELNRSMTSDSQFSSSRICWAGEVFVPGGRLSRRMPSAPWTIRCGRTDVTGRIDESREDALHRMTRIEQAGVTGGNAVAEKRIDLTYDAGSQWQTITRYADLAATKLVATSDYTFDAAGRLTVLSHAQGATPLAGYSWTYDAGNRITEFTSLPDGMADYTYDQTDQLVDAEYDYQDDEAFAYDANGNRTMTGYATGDNNLVLSDGVHNYEYDAEGNRTRRTHIASGEVTDYQWDHRNRLTKIISKDSAGNGTKSVEYTYDVQNRRVAKLISPGIGPAQIEHFVYDGERQERGNAGDVIVLHFKNAELADRYVHGPAVDQILAEEQINSPSMPGDVLWPLTDNLGTVRDLAAHDDTTGITAIANHLTYDAFGQITAETSPAVDHLFGYTGRETDEESDLYHYRARYYDPALGRFLSEDPIGFEANDANLHRYVGNGATNDWDPSGLEKKERKFGEGTIFEVRKTASESLAEIKNDRWYTLAGIGRLLFGWTGWGKAVDNDIQGNTGRLQNAEHLGPGKLSAGGNFHCSEGTKATMTCLASYPVIAATVLSPGPEDFVAGPIGTWLAQRGLRVVNEGGEWLLKRGNTTVARGPHEVGEAVRGLVRCSKNAPRSGKWNRPNVQDSTLKDVMDNLWRPPDKRPGGTLAELLREKAAGGPLIHLEKAKGRLTQLIKRVNDHSNPLSKADRAAAERVINDLKDAIRIAEGR